jgi:CheY-like chemotaxis protein
MGDYATVNDTTQVTSLKGKRVLYIEDDPRNRGIVQIILRQAGADVRLERAGNLNMVLTALRRYHPVDLILLDLMFPSGLTGYDVYEAISEEEPFNQIPVVVISASDPAIEIPRSKDLGLQGFISKPLSMSDFPQQLLQVLNGDTVWVADSH